MFDELNWFVRVPLLLVLCAARSPLLELRRAPGARLPRWPTAYRPAVLHERRRHELYARRREGGKGPCVGRDSSSSTACRRCTFACKKPTCELQKIEVLLLLCDRGVMLLLLLELFEGQLRVCYKKNDVMCFEKDQQQKI